jgi:hypothetical protein
MKKQKLVLIPFLSMLFTLSAFADWESKTISEVAVMHARDDGKYDIFCTNGTREMVTDLDLRLNNVCPNLKSSKPTNILSLQKRADGDFDVVCRSLKKLVATEAQIIEGSVCGNNPPRVILEDGIYKVIEGYQSYYDQTITTKMEGEILKGLTLKAQQSGWTCELACEGLTCKGVRGDANCPSSVLDVLGPKQYRYRGNLPEAIFEKQ